MNIIIRAVLAALALTASVAFAQVVPNTATISFTAPAARLDGTPITGTLSYGVYQGVKGQTKTKVATITTTTSTINTGLLSNVEYCWEVTAQEGTGPESTRSNEAFKAFGASPPQKVTITVQ
jgi:hypothetical protein